MLYFSFLASAEAEIANCPPEGTPQGGRGFGGSRGWGQLRKLFEMISTSLMLNFSFLASTEAELAN